MFRYPQDKHAQTVTVYIEGAAVGVPENTSVAAAVLAHTDEPTRTTPVSQAPRAPFCMMGVCFECLMVIDGQANRQACMEMVREGMTIQKQVGTGVSTG